RQSNRRRRVGPSRAGHLGLRAHVGQAAARNLLPAYFDANRSVANSRPVAPQSQGAVDAAAGHPGKVPPVRSESRGASRAPAKARVSPVRWSNRRTGGSPPSPDSQRPDDRRRAEKVQDLRPGGWYTQRSAPWSLKGPGTSTG